MVNVGRRHYLNNQSSVIERGTNITFLRSSFACFSLNSLALYLFASLVLPVVIRVFENFRFLENFGTEALRI